MDNSDEELLDFLNTDVREGTGAIEFSMTENGSIGLFVSGLEGAQGTGDTVREAIMDYRQQEDPGYPLSRHSM